MGNGMAVDLKHLCGEIDSLASAGVKIDENNLVISDRAVVCMPYDVMQDCLEENRLADRKFGSTRRGIAPVYGDKYLKKAIRMGELLDMDRLALRLKEIVEWKNLTLSAYGDRPISYDEMLAYLREYGGRRVGHIRDAGLYLDRAAAEGKNIMFEAQLGALRDIDFGIYPFTTSSSTISAYAPIGSGIPNRRIDRAVGIMKAYSTCVGEGPFVGEYFGDKAEALRREGGEYGAATGRPRRVAPFDAVASRYGCRMQAASELALTKLDVLGYLDEIEVCVGYELDGKRTDEFPFPDFLPRCKPIIEKLPGWKTDISACRTAEQLPPNARGYVDFIEKLVGCPITYVSVGAEREQYLVRKR